MSWIHYSRNIRAIPLRRPSVVSLGTLRYYSFNILYSGESRILACSFQKNINLVQPMKFLSGIEITLVPVLPHVLFSYRYIRTYNRRYVYPQKSKQRVQIKVAFVLALSPVKKFKRNTTRFFDVALRQLKNHALRS